MLGVDPNGQQLVDNHLFQDPQVLRALFLAVEALTDHDLSSKLDTSEPHLKRAGLPWTEAEDDQLRSEFQNRINIQIITQIHMRTQGAIASRLVHLKLIEKRDQIRDLLAWS